MLSIDALSHTYPGAARPALCELSLNISGDGVYGLLGPNGAGKTTLISAIAGVLQPDCGEIRLDGQPLAGIRREDPRAIALVPQDQAFYPMLTVRENLRFFAGILDLSGATCAARIDECLAFARLQQVADQRAEQLSGGLRRRLNLAIGLLGRPRLLLLDEPTVGVDPQSRHFLLESIAALPAAGTRVIYTSHYMDEVQAICRHLAILDHGRVLLAGPLDSLLHNEETVIELAAGSELPAALSERHGAIPGQPGCYRLNRPGTAALAELLADLAAAGIVLERLHYGQQDLEQVFMSLTQRSLRD
jgi:ABC-2 type transport system ATP-binding protein